MEVYRMTDIENGELEEMHSSQGPRPTGKNMKIYPEVSAAPVAASATAGHHETIESELHEAIQNFKEMFHKTTKVKTEPRQAIRVDKGWKQWIIRIIVLVIGLAVFIASLVYFLQQKLQLLVTSSQLNQCVSYYGVSTFLNSQQSTFLPMNINDYVNGATVNTFQMYAIGNWSTCNVPITDRNFAFKKNYTSQSYDLTFNPLEDDYLSLFNVSNVMPARDRDGQNYADNCFQLNCYITSTPSFGGSGDDDNAIVYGSYNQNISVNSQYSQSIELTASILVEAQTVTGSCLLSMYGTFLPYFTATQSVDVSGVYECTANADPFAAVANAFANTSTAYGVALFIAIVFYLLIHYPIQELINFLQDGGKFEL